MSSIINKISDWLHDLLVEGVMNNLTGMINAVNNEVGSIASDVSQTPANFSPTIFAMIRNISETVIIPIAGIILTFIVCYELIQLIIEHNNLQNFETWIFLKWIFKTFVAVTIISHTFDITMAIFDVAQHVINRAGGIVGATTGVTQSQIVALAASVDAMSNGALFGLYLQSAVVQITLFALSKIIFVIVYARMIEIYLMTSLAPIPLSTFGNKEQSQIGQNYLRSLFALGFQGFLMCSLNSCGMIFGGVSGGSVSATYTAEDADIRGAEADYQAKEAALQTKMNNYQSLYPGYDEYRSDFGSINHDTRRLILSEGSSAKNRAQMRRSRNETSILSLISRKSSARTRA